MHPEQNLKRNKAVKRLTNQEGTMKKTANIIATGALFLACFGASANATEIEVKMLNHGPDGAMVFSPAFVKIAPGDSVHFVAADKGHNIESIPGMMPEGVTPSTGKMNEDLTVKFDKPGVYGMRCMPHYGLGMVSLIVVGNPVNEDAAKAIVLPGKAKERMAKLFAQLDAQKSASK
jgi:pseudoazurin